MPASTPVVKTTLLFAALATTAFAQYKLDQAGALPTGIAPSVAQLLSKQGQRVNGPDGKVAFEIFLTAKAPSGPKTTEEAVTLTTVPVSSLVGVISFPQKWSDRRGQTIKPGVYTLRFNLFPITGDHQGVATQRDFFILSLAGDDQDGAAAPTFDQLMTMSRKASGTPHPLVLSVWKVDNDFAPGFAKQGENDWALQTMLGDTKIAIILVGKSEG